MKKFSLALACLTLISALLSACSFSPSESDASAQAALPASSPAQPTREPTPTSAPRQWDEYVAGRDPLTGEPVDEGDRSRPIAVMLQNDSAGYPQWGIKGAEVLVEAITEGKTTSMMALYSGHEGLPERVGAVGPARDLFWQIALPANSILMQIGSNVYASNLLNVYQYQNLDGRYVGVTAFDLDYEKDKTANHEYCWFTTQELMEAGLEHYGLSREGDRRSLFNFADEDQDGASASTEGAASSEPAGSTASGDGTEGSPAAVQPPEAARIEITFAEDNTIPLLYNADSGRWEKYDRDWQPHVDGTYPEDMDPMEKILSFDNVLVLYCRAGVKDDGYTRDYDLTEGTGLYLNGPTCQLIRWQKCGVTGGFLIYDQDGQVLPIRQGKSYVAIYGGFAGQGMMVQNSAGEELALWEDSEPMPAPEPVEPAPQPPEDGGDSSPEEGGDEGVPEEGDESQPEG